MDFNYKTLFRLSFQHNYYGSGVLSGVSVKVAPETALALQNYGLAWKQAKDQMVVLYDVEDANSESKLKDLVEDGVKLKFMVFVEEPTLLNFTDLPFEGGQDSLYFFSNATATKKNDGNTLMLSKDAYVSSNDKVKVFQSAVKIGQSDVQKSNNAVIIDIFKDKTDANYTVKEGFVEVSLPNGGTGFYTYSDGNGAVPLYVDGDLGWKLPFSIIEIHFDKKVDESHRPVKNNGKIEPMNYVIGFNSRSVFWKYYIMSAHLRDLEGLVIANGKADIEFVGPNKEQVLGRLESESFISNKALPFSEQRKYRFQLHKNFDKKRGAGKIVMKSLPNPDPTRLKPMDGQPGQYYTEIYIY